MTKSIITLLLTFYSVARLSAIAYYLYYGIEGLPPWVLLITSACCLVCLGAAVAHYRGRLRGATLRSVLMLVAAGASANMLILYLNPINNLGNTELLITGTLFDVVFYLGAVTLRMPDGPPRQSPFPSAPLRRHKRPDPGPGDQELEALLESIPDGEEKEKEENQK